MFEQHRPPQIVLYTQQLQQTSPTMNIIASQAQFPQSHQFQISTTSQPNYFPPSFQWPQQVYSGYQFETVYGPNSTLYNSFENQVLYWNLLNVSKVGTSPSAEEIKLESSVKAEAMIGPRPDRIDSNIIKEEAVDTTVNPIDGEEESEMRVNKRYKAYVKAIKDTYRERHDIVEGPFEEIYEKELERLKQTIDDTHVRSGVQKSVACALNSVRCNLTKYVRGTLKCMAKASAELFPASTEQATQLFNELQKCTRVEHFRSIIYAEGREVFLQFLSEFVLPGHLFLRMIHRMDYSAVVSVLILEALLVFQKMVLQPTALFSSWKLGKLDLIGDYAEPIRKLEEGSAAFPYVRSWVDKEYKKCKSKFKKTKCSQVNNITHFLCQITQQMLLQIYEDIKLRKIAATNQVCEVLENSLNLLKVKHNEETLLQVVQHEFVKKEVNTRFLENNRLLRMILEIRTNALMVKNLVDRYPWFSGMLKR